MFTLSCYGGIVLVSGNDQIKYGLCFGNSQSCEEDTLCVCAHIISFYHYAVYIMQRNL